jgi:hypothetical protein
MALFIGTDFFRKHRIENAYFANNSLLIFDTLNIHQ